MAQPMTITKQQQTAPSSVEVYREESAMGMLIFILLVTSLTLGILVAAGVIANSIMNGLLADLDQARAVMAHLQKIDVDNLNAVAAKLAEYTAMTTPPVVKSPI